MKESHSKDPASHADPESCGPVREDCPEALTGAGAGEVLSHEISYSGLPTLLSEAEGNTNGDVIASRRLALRGRRPVARVETSCARTGRSLDCPANVAIWAASGRPKAVRR